MSLIARYAGGLRNSCMRQGAGPKRLVGGVVLEMWPSLERVGIASWIKSPYGR